MALADLRVEFPPWMHGQSSLPRSSTLAVEVVLGEPLVGTYVRQLVGSSPTYPT